MAARPIGRILTLLLLLYGASVQYSVGYAQNGSLESWQGRNEPGAISTPSPRPRRLPPVPARLKPPVSQVSLEVPAQGSYAPRRISAWLERPHSDLVDPDISQDLLSFPTLPDHHDAQALFHESDSTATRPNLVQPQQHEHAWWVPMLELAAMDAERLPVTLDELFILTAENSFRLRAAVAATDVARARIMQAEGAFDPVYFAEHKYAGTNDPVESTLATGGPPRLNENTLGLDAGIRGQANNGIIYSAGQRVGLKDSNSNFFSPPNQATSRLRAGITQPLLRGRVTDANRTLLVTARCESLSAEAELTQALQDQLLEVGDVYWSLYFEHASRVQRNRHLDRARSVLDMLRSRVEHDVVQSQIFRAESAVRLREAELVKLEARIGNLESRLRQLVNAPILESASTGTLLPMEPPFVYEIELDVPRIIKEAVDHSPEVMQLALRLTTATARLRLAADQKKPQVNLNLEGYIAGLEGNNQILDSWANQFDSGPGFSASLAYERPANNRLARGASQQYRYEMVQLQNLIEEAKQKARSDAETAIRNLQVSFVAVRSRQSSLAAAQLELENLHDRWQTLGDDPRLGQIQLSELLQAQDRVLQEEQSLLSAMIEFQLELLAVKRWDGSLITILSTEETD